MSLTIFCDRCGKELETMGAVLNGPPYAADTKLGPILQAEKLHTCGDCWFIIREVVLGIVMEVD